jgi:hypothetical protein
MTASGSKAGHAGMVTVVVLVVDVVVLELLVLDTLIDDVVVLVVDVVVLVLLVLDVLVDDVDVLLDVVVLLVDVVVLVVPMQTPFVQRSFVVSTEPSSQGVWFGSVEQVDNAPIAPAQAWQRSTAHRSSQPSPSISLWSSHGSPGSRTPSPHGPPAKQHASSRKLQLEQHSLASHCSPRSRRSLPH